MVDEKTTANDMDRLREAFAEFRKRGYWARMNQAGGQQAVPEDLIRRGGKWVCWHENETLLSFGPDGNLKAPLHLRHTERDTQEIVKTLERVGLVFRTRVAVDNSPLGGVVILPLSPRRANTSTDRQLYVGRRYVMPFGEVREWYVASASPDVVQLVAKDTEHTWFSMSWKAFAELMVNNQIVPVVEAA